MFTTQKSQTPVQGTRGSNASISRRLAHRGRFERSISRRHQETRTSVGQSISRNLNQSQLNFLETMKFPSICSFHQEVPLCNSEKIHVIHRDSCMFTEWHFKVTGGSLSFQITATHHSKDVRAFGLVGESANLLQKFTIASNRKWSMASQRKSTTHRMCSK